MKKYTHKVQYYETDRMQITHHSNYIRFMEEARMYFLEQLGWGYDKMEEMGIISPVVKVSCRYKKTTTFADVIEIDVKVSKITPLKLFLEYTMTVGDEVVCTATSCHCFINKKGKPVFIEKTYPEFYKAAQSLQKEY